ncbi:MAG TPA: response regulator transcription factor [Bryobacteraceae bacterium]|nr:response regulator transcription factor [Bryobacteraceae bacterium]
MQILVVEDERRMADLLKRGLEEEGHAVVVSGRGPEALSIARTHPFDAIVLDVMLPGMSGLDVARRLRESHVQTPILMLTARDGIDDVVQGLDHGADDYVTKPFSFEILLARIRALARRAPISNSLQLHLADLTLDTGSREASRRERKIALTRTEYTLLELLMKRPGRVVEREQIMEALWGHDASVENNTLDVFIRLLRSKIEQPGEMRLIHTVRGVGYVMKDS